MNKFLGVLALLAWGVYASVIALLNPAVLAAKFQTGSLPQLLKLAKLAPLAPKDYVLVAQVASGLFIALSALIFFNIGRKVACHLLVDAIIVSSVLVFVDIENPTRLSEETMVNLLKNLAIVGGLWILASHKSARKVAGTSSTSPSPSGKKKQ